MTYEVEVAGCDDYTTITVELSDVEAAVVKKIAMEITNASTYICMPRMSIEPLTEKEKEEVRDDH